MIRLVLMATLCVLALLATGTGLISIIEWTIKEQFVGLLEYPEKNLVATCLSSATSLLSARAIRSEHVSFRILRAVSFWTALVIGFVAMLTKTVISTISADRDIHQWHLICIWSGGLLLALSGGATFSTTSSR